MLPSRDEERCEKDFLTLVPRVGNSKRSLYTAFGPIKSPDSYSWTLRLFGSATLLASV